MILASHAKINVWLHARGKRPDGYHDIESLIVPISLHDDIIIANSERLRVTVEGASIEPEKNLALRAAKLLSEKYGSKQGAAIHITKRIPIGAGLGGGSSNAASVLVALNKLWNIKATSEELARLGLALGSDVPFFIHGTPAIARGRGELLTQTTFPQQSVLIVVPKFSVATPWAYAQLDASKWPRDSDNDFFPVIAAAHPEILHLKKQLLELGASAASLSGTGSALFGFFSTPEALATAARKLSLVSCIKATTLPAINQAMKAL